MNFEPCVECFPHSSYLNISLIVPCFWASNNFITEDKYIPELQTWSLVYLNSQCFPMQTYGMGRIHCAYHLATGRLSCRYFWLVFVVCRDFKHATQCSLYSKRRKKYTTCTYCLSTYEGNTIENTRGTNGHLWVSFGE